MSNPFDPLTFVGLPDWRSVPLALLFTLPWLLVLGWGHLRRWQLWAALAVAAIVFPISIAWVQMPIQQGLNVLWMRVLDLATIQRLLLLVGAPSIAVSGLVQESVKFLVALAGLALLRSHKAPQPGDPAEATPLRQPRLGLAIGAAAGAGYGGFEAFWVFNTIFASGFTWAMVQLSGGAALLGFFERLYAVPFHVGSVALAGYGYATGRPWRFLLLASGLHGLLNYGALLMKAGILNAITVEIWGAIVAVATIGSALWLRQRAGKLEAAASA